MKKSSFCREWYERKTFYIEITDVKHYRKSWIQKLIKWVICEGRIEWIFAGNAVRCSFYGWRGRGSSSPFIPLRHFGGTEWRFVFTGALVREKEYCFRDEAEKISNSRENKPRGVKVIRESLMTFVLGVMCTSAPGAMGTMSSPGGMPPMPGSPYHQGHRIANKKKTETRKILKQIQAVGKKLIWLRK